jgi:hypothetical protein
LEAVARRDRLDAGFLRESEATMLLNRYHFGQLFSSLKRSELEFGPLRELLTQLDGLIADFQRIAASLQAAGWSLPAQTLPLAS